jgi:fibronectin type 3 domain-containing protein
MRLRWLASLLILLLSGFAQAATLGAPTSLTASATSTTSIRINWVDNLSSSPNEDGFSIERSVSATTGFVVVATTLPNATTYQNFGLVTGTLYYYRVRAFSGQVFSSYSNVVSIAPSASTDTTVPSVPTGLAATAASCSQINLAWAASTDTGSGVGSYRVYRNNALLRQVAAPATSTSDTGLLGSTTYSYQVSAVDKAGNESARSAVVSRATLACSTTTDLTAPSVPTGLTTTAASCSQINLAWNASSDTGGSGMAGYRIYRNSVFLKQVAASPTTTSDAGLAASTVYGYQASAVDNAGHESARSATVSTNTPACVVSSGGAHLWSRRMGGTVVADSVVPYGVAVDGSGNVVVTGVFYGTVDFGTGAVTSVGRGDMFLAKYSAGGAVQWVKRFGDPADQFGTAVGTDTSGNVYVAGYYYGTVNFGGTTLTSAAYDIVLAKYTANGAHVWSKRIGGAGYDMAQALDVDGSGNVLIAGQFSGATDFGGGALTSAGGYDGFVAKYTTNGAYVWSKRMGGASLDTVTGLGVDALGNPTVVGYFAGTANFGGANLTSAGGNDVFVARYTAAGVHQWSTRFGDANDQRAYAAAVDGAGNVVLTGYFNGAVSFGGTTFTNTGGADIFLVKLTAGGAHAWSKAFGTGLAYGEMGEAVAIDAAGNVVLTGEIVENVNFGGTTLVGTGTYDVFAAKFSSAGVHQWSKRFTSDWDDHGNAVAVDGTGNVVMSGDFYQWENFGGGLLSSPGGSDGFLVKLTP